MAALKDEPQKIKGGIGSRKLPVASWLLASALLGACQTEVQTQNGHHANAAAEIAAWGGSGTTIDNGATGDVGTGGSAKTGSARAVRPRDDGPAWDWTDPCSENLHELTGLLLLYYQQHKELPATLDLLPTKSLGGEDVSIKCPRSGKEYVYFPEGLVPPEDIVPLDQRARGGNRLILYDAEPVHDATQHLTDGEKNWDVKKKIRFGIVVEPPGIDGSIRMQVVPIEQDLLEAYQREAQARRQNQQQTSPQPGAPLRRPGSNGLW